MYSSIHFAAERVDALDPAAFDRRNQGRMRVEGPVAADLAFQAERIAVSRQQQFDGGGVEADAVVQGRHFMPLVDAADDHHGHQDLQFGDVARVAREQRLERKRTVGFDHEIDPRGRNVDARQLVDDFIDLGDHDAVAEGGRFDDGRRVFGVRPGVQIAFAVGLHRAHQRHLRREVDEHACIQFDVGVDGADFELAVFEQLRHAQRLRAGEGKVEFFGDAGLEDAQMFGAADGRDQQVQVVHLGRVDLGQRARQEVGLFLVIAFERNAVARPDQHLQGIGDLGRIEKFSLAEGDGGLDPCRLVVATAEPGFCLVGCGFGDSHYFPW